MKTKSSVLLFKVVNRFGKVVRKILPSEASTTEESMVVVNRWADSHRSELPLTLIKVERVEKEVRKVIDFV